MEKASKWIRNYLTGKKEEKYMTDTSSIENKIAESPKVKRRWSFGRRTSGGKVTMHRISRSFDSSHSAAKLHTEFEVETHKEPPKDIKSLAATKIQAAFRSYLARKALHALRGLVKIQALVRGHLVRKQTSATLRSMHALMAIQVRARIHRIQTAEEANLLLRKHSSLHREITRDKACWRECKDSKDMSVREMVEVESRSGLLDGSHVVTTFYSGHLTDAKRKYGYKENTFITEPRSHSLSSCQVSWEPNYLTKTESSRAKARSFSEPKQRPKRGTRIKTSQESTKDFVVSLEGRRLSLSSNSSSFNSTSLDHWVLN